MAGVKTAVASGWRNEYNCDMAKRIVTHASPDWDAITSVWLLKRYLPGWNEAIVSYVPAGTSYGKTNPKALVDPIEIVGEEEIIHVDTGLGPLDHHQTSDQNVCGASRTWDYVKTQNPELKNPNEKWEFREEAIGRMVQIVVDTDHFKEVFWENPTADYHEFSLLGLLDGMKLFKPNQDEYYMEFGMECLDAMLHNFENRIWAEKEIKENGIIFETRWGKGIGFDTLNDDVLKLAQKMGYNIVIRKDPRKGYVRIKARPLQSQISNVKSQKGEKEIDLTLAYEQLSKMDPQATWFLHVSKKMLLNGTTKNPTMKPTTLSLAQIIAVLKSV